MLADRLDPAAQAHDTAVKRRLLADPDRRALAAAVGDQAVRRWAVDALADYLALCRRDGEASLSGLTRDANLRGSFEPGALADAVDAVEEVLRTSAPRGRNAPSTRRPTWTIAVPP